MIVLKGEKPPAGSLQGKDRPPLLRDPFPFMSFYSSIETNWDNVCGEQNDPNSVHCLVALLKHPQNSWKWAVVFFMYIC